MDDSEIGDILAKRWVGPGGMDFSADKYDLMYHGQKIDKVYLHGDLVWKSFYEEPIDCIPAYQMVCTDGAYINFTYLDADIYLSIEEYAPEDLEHLTFGEHLFPVVDARGLIHGYQYHPEAPLDGMYNNVWPFEESVEYVFRLRTGAKVKCIAGSGNWSRSAIITNGDGWSYWPNGTAVFNNLIGYTRNGRVFKYEIFNASDRKIRILGDFEQWFGGTPSQVCLI